LSRAGNRNVIASTQRARSFAVAVVLVCAPGLAAAGGYERTFELGANKVEVGLRYDDALPGAATVAGEGRLRTELPGAGELTLTVPHLLGQTGGTLGAARVGADYGLLEERELLPSLGFTARVDLPTARGTHDVFPGVKAIATKNLDLGVLEAVHVESELWTDTRTLLPGYRTAVRTILRLRPSTTGSLELVRMSPPLAPGSTPEKLAQFGLSQRVSEDTGLSAGFAVRSLGGASSLQGTLGFHTRF